MKNRKIGLLIGRFHGPHLGHEALIRYGLSLYDGLIICIGSARQARSPRNPFTCAERQKMIESVLTPEERARIQFINVRDYLYNDNLWIIEIQQKVQEIIDYAPDVKINILGRFKDRTSYYLRIFPQWECDEYGVQHPFDATMVRDAMFDGNWNAVKTMVSNPIYEYLIEWSKTEHFSWALEEKRFYDKYKADWANTPYPVVFNTTDAVIIQSGHVLVVERKFNPGKGLFALPGGFLQKDKTIEESMLNELKEETKIAVPRKVLLGSVVDQKTFDHPDRSLRGRTITHAYCIVLEDGELAPVRGADDAARASWIPLADLYAHEEKFFEDHVHIIRYFAPRANKRES